MENLNSSKGRRAWVINDGRRWPAARDSRSRPSHTRGCRPCRDSLSGCRLGLRRRTWGCPLRWHRSAPRSSTPPAAGPCTGRRPVSATNRVWRSSATVEPYGSRRRSTHARPTVSGGTYAIVRWQEHRARLVPLSAGA